MKKSELQNLDSLFQQLSAGQTPNFFEMMSALSDVSTIWPDNQQATPQSCGEQNRECLVSLYPNFQPRCVGGNCG